MRQKIADARKAPEAEEEKVVVRVAKQKVSPWTPLQDPEKYLSLRHI